MKIKKIIFLLIIIILIIISIFIIKTMTKNKKNGNNMSSQEVVDSILNLSSYKAKISVEVKSNKNENKYIIEQEYNANNECIQKVLEPENIAGVTIIKKDNNLSIQNTELDLNTILENYQGLEDNSLDLISFISDYKENENKSYEEINGEIIMKVNCTENNPYIKNKILYINKKEIRPTKLIIQDYNQNTTINIEYKEIELN